MRPLTPIATACLVLLAAPGAAAEEPARLPRSRPDVVIHEGTYPGWPWAAAAPDGTIYVVYREGTIHDFSAEGRVLIRESRDRGSSWSASRVVADAPGVDDRNAAVAVLPGGDLLVSYNTYTEGRESLAMLVRSQDGGRTWSPPRPVGEPNTRTRAAAVPLADGSLLLPYYVAPGNGALAALSRDGGETWRTARVPDAEGFTGDEWTALELAPGRIAGVFRNSHPGSDGTFWASRSEDGGATWSVPVPTNVRSERHSSPAHLVSHRGVPVLFHADRRMVSVSAVTTRDPELRSWGVSGRHPCYLYTPDGAPIADGSYPCAVSTGPREWLVVDYEIREGPRRIAGYFVELPEEWGAASRPPPSEIAVIPGVDGQPLGANAVRLLRALEVLGAPLPEAEARGVEAAAGARDAERIQRLLDPHVLVAVSINPEYRVKAARGPAPARLQQGGWTPHLVKVVNDATVEAELRISSAQAGPVYAGAALPILERQAQTELAVDENEAGAADRFLDVEVLRSSPMTPRLSGLRVEYAVALLHASEAGPREATLAFDVGQGTQDIGFRAEVPVLFDVKPAVRVRLAVLDERGRPTVGRFTFRDALGRIQPPQAKRLAPDFFFQPQVYREHGGTVLLAPGRYRMEHGRGPEYRVLEREVEVPSAPEAAADAESEISVRLERWIDPAARGFYSGDHHIHGAGCSHYTVPTQGVTPRDMFLQVKGEALNVGCVLTWGPCFDHQRQFFAPSAHGLSEPFTVLKYDIEVSGFGSAALGHVCLLRLRDPAYPGSDGTKTKGWPTWTVPVLRWCKEQGGVTGYPHSAMPVSPKACARRLLAKLDSSADGRLDAGEAARGLLPHAFGAIDADGDGAASERELEASCDRAADELPNLAVPEMNGQGAMEVFVSVPAGVCDFISAMDTARIGEWNTWYHLLDCGFPLKVSGETDFPCMSSRRVGQGRVYVQLGPVDRVDFDAWCEGLARGRSYVSDGFAHALRFVVNGVAPGSGRVELAEPGNLVVEAEVAFAEETPVAVAHGTLEPAAGRRLTGDTVQLHAPRSEERVRGGERLVEVVWCGRVAASARVPADARPHALRFEVPAPRSGWLALRQFPQLHTNPVDVIVGGKPIRASRRSARWCAEAVELLWESRHRFIAEPEREEARRAYDRAVETYRRIAAECPEDS
ncbi:MAG: exo-alpha-sialidase [Planctomycetes bacterium]|nr:exo-alpha-sialidase [Planctomycetota bacterium]